MPRPIKFTVDGANPVGPSVNGFVTDQYSQGPLTVQAVAVGSVTHTLEVTHDDPFQAGGPVNWFNHTEAATVNCTASYQATLINMPRAIRIVRNAGPGSVECVIGQLTTQG